MIVGLFAITSAHAADAPAAGGAPADAPAAPDTAKPGKKHGKHMGHHAKGEHHKKGKKGAAPAAEGTN